MDIICTTSINSGFCIIKSINKIISRISETTIIVLTEIALHLVALSKIVTSTASIGKFISKTIQFTSTSTIYILTQHIYNKILTILSTSAVTINLLRNKVLTVSSQTIFTINKQIGKIFSVISVTISSIPSSLFPRLGAVVRFTFVADVRDRSSKLFKSRLVEKVTDRAVKLFKIRNLFSNSKKTNIKK